MTRDTVQLVSTSKNPAVRSARPRVLVVDDDQELCQLIAQYMAPEGYDVDAVHDGAGGVERAVAGQHALVVLDVMLPDISGFEVLRRVRLRSQVAILMLTGRGDDHDRILGLEMGADDYLSKPFNPRELCARIEAILRRVRLESAAPDSRTAGYIVLDDVAMDRGARTVRRGGTSIELTSVEFDLLDTFLRSAGQVIPRDELVQTVLKREFSPFDRSIDTHVSNLRKKLGATEDGLERIKGVRGIGYQYVVPYRPDHPAAS